MYRLSTPLTAVKGIGPALAAAFDQQKMHTVRDIVMYIPLRYEDRSTKKTIAELQSNELVTIAAEVTTSSNYYKGRRSIQSATVKDDTGRLKLMWFNNPHIVARFKKGERIFISGKINDRGVMVQPIVETISDDTIHTGRLVPIYSLIPNIPGATLRRLLKHVIDHLDVSVNNFETFLQQEKISPLRDAITHIHFPENESTIIQARERFAIEELLALIQHSQQLKEKWQSGNPAVKISVSEKIVEIKKTLPFSLTTAQERCINEILNDLQSTIPMNRLLIGDVGSGKTAVAGFACVETLAAGFHVAFVAPTQILAEQHYATFQKLFPRLRVQLLTAKTKKSDQIFSEEPTLFLGTHAVLHQLEKIKPALLIYDEQHRFGVEQRSIAQHLLLRPHILTLSATPIPRTLMLTIFSHLQLSLIDEMPAGRQPVKTWVVPESKRKNAYGWIEKQLKTTSDQAFIVCPFIDQSETDGFEHIAAATEMFAEVKKLFPKMAIALLHGKLAKEEQKNITQQLYERKINILVTTPIVEVGIDVPAATIIVIEAAERFGLASLHQMRGRVGRAGQEAFCLLFTNSKNTDTKKRLKFFSETHDGIKLAEQDLQRRGAGDIFGTQQHGFDELHFASWTNVELIAKAKHLSEVMAQQQLTWQPFIQLKKGDESDIPLAN